MATKEADPTESPLSNPGVQVPGALSSGGSSDDSIATPQQQSKPGLITRLRHDIDPAYSDIPLLVCSFVSGLCDSVAFNASNVFVSMQTGKSIPIIHGPANPYDKGLPRPHSNTIFLALGTARLPSGSTTLWLKALVSIVAFWAGCFCFGQTRRFRPKSKRTLALSFLVQSLLILISAAVAQSGVVPAFAMSSLGSEGSELVLKSYATNPMTMIPVALMAFQFGGQIVTSRVLGFNEVPTNVLTSLYCDLFSDPLLFGPLGKNAKRNRRIVAALLMFFGSVVGGWLQKSKAGMPCPLWIAGALKMAIAVLWMSWREKQVQKDEKV